MLNLNKNKMIKHFFTVCLALGCLCASAQIDLNGTVKTENGKPLEGAIVSLDNTIHRTYTDQKGRYFLFNLKPGEYQLRVTLLGYYEYMQTIDLKSNIFSEVVLFKKPYVTDEVLVTTSRVTSETPVTQSTVSKAQIEENNRGKDVPTLMDALPGVVTTSDAGAGIGYTGLRIRGSDATRVNVTINGIPVNDAESQGMYWVDLPDILSSTGQIQVQRGLGTSVNGAGAFGGSVNMTTEQLSENAFAESNLSYGSYNTKKINLKAGTGLLKNKFSFETRLSKITSSGYIDRASSDLNSFYVSGGYYGNKTLVKAIIFSGKENTYQSWYGTPESRYKNDVQGMMDYISRNGLDEEDAANLLNSGRTYNYYLYPNQMDRYRQDYYQLHFSHQFSSVLTVNAALHLTRGIGYYEEYKKNQKLSDYGLSPVNLGDTIIKKTDLVRRKWLDNYFYGIIYGAKWEKDKLSVAFNGGFSQYDGDHYGDIIWSKYTAVANEQRYYFNNGFKQDWNNSIRAHYHLNLKWTAYVDLQHRYVSYKFDGFDAAINAVPQKVIYNFFNPKAGITFKRNAGEQAYLSVAIGNKEPSRDDFTDSSPLSRPKPEHMTDVEAGYSLSLKKFNAGINFYAMMYDNQLLLTGKINDVGNYTRQNVKNSYRAGVEVQAEYHLNSQLSLSGNAAFSKNKIKKFEYYLDEYDAAFDYTGQTLQTFSNTDISFSPNVVAAAGIAYKPFAWLKIALNEKYVGRQYLDNTQSSDKSLDAFYYTNAVLEGNFNLKKYASVNIGITLYNLLNAKYANNGYTYGYVYDGTTINETYYYPQALMHYLAYARITF